MRPRGTECDTWSDLPGKGPDFIAAAEKLKKGRKLINNTFIRGKKPLLLLIADFHGETYAADLQFTWNEDICMRVKTHR